MPICRVASLRPADVSAPTRPARAWRTDSYPTRARWIRLPMAFLGLEVMLIVKASRGSVSKDLPALETLDHALAMATRFFPDADEGTSRG